MKSMKSNGMFFIFAKNRLTIFVVDWLGRIKYRFIRFNVIDIQFGNFIDVSLYSNNSKRICLYTFLVLHY